MKKWIILLALLACFMLLAACEKASPEKDAEEDEETASETQDASEDSKIRLAVPEGKIDFIGSWRLADEPETVITIVPSRSKEVDFAVLVRRSIDEREFNEWAFSGVFDEETRDLNYKNGSKYRRSYSEDMQSVSEELLWSDSEGWFCVNDDRMLEWTDSRESDADWRFERVYSETPSAQDILENFYLPVGRIEQGTAGSSLKNAVTTCEIVAYVDKCELWNVNSEELHETMFAAWDLMTDDQQDAFNANYSGVNHLMTATMKSWDSRAGVFADAGVGDRMKELMESDFARFSWATLSANLMTMNYT